MGVDFEYCNRCTEYSNEYLFSSCTICHERCEFCDDCNNEYLITLNKMPCFLCDNCSLGFDDSDPHINLYIKDIAKENKMFKYSVIKILNTEKIKRSKTKDIEKLEKEVENLKIVINDQLEIIGIASLNAKLN